MMKNHNLWAGIVAGILLALFTVLLVTKQIGELTYAGVIVGSMLVSVTVAVLPRLSELDLKNLRLVLAEIKKTKAEIEAMYGGLEGIKRNRRSFDYQKIQGGGSIAMSGAMRNYISGCITRERERLAKIFVVEKSPEKLAEAILDNKYDLQVFRWAGMGSSIDDPIPDDKMANEPKIEPVE